MINELFDSGEKIETYFGDIQEKDSKYKMECCWTAFKSNIQ